MRLDTLAKGRLARVKKIHPSEVAPRLMEMGILEGTSIEIVHEAPFGKDPIAVRARGTLIAVRRDEARNVEVEIDTLFEEKP